MRRAALLLELALSLALITLLGVAVFRFWRVLERFDAGWPIGLAFTLVFAAAAVFAARKARSVLRLLRRNESDDVSREP